MSAEDKASYQNAYTIALTLTSTQEEMIKKYSKFPIYFQSEVENIPKAIFARLPRDYVGSKNASDFVKFVSFCFLV